MASSSSSSTATSTGLPAPPTLALWLSRALADATERGQAADVSPSSSAAAQGNNSPSEVAGGSDKAEAEAEGDDKLVSTTQEQLAANVTLDKSDVLVVGEEVSLSQPAEQQPEVKEGTVRMQMHVDVRKKRTEIETEKQRLQQTEGARRDKILRSRRHSTPGRHTVAERSAGVLESDEEEEEGDQAREGDERTPLAAPGPDRHKRKRRRRKRNRKSKQQHAAPPSVASPATPSTRGAPLPSTSFSSGMGTQEAGASTLRRPPAKPYYETYPFSVVEETIWQGTSWPAGILSPLFCSSTHWFITNKRIDYVMGFGGRISESVELHRITELRYERDCVQFMLCGRGTIVIVLDEYSPVEELQISGWGLKRPFQQLRAMWQSARVDQERPIGRLTRAEEDDLIRRKLSQAGVVHPAFEEAFAAADDLERARARSGGLNADITCSAPPTPASSY